VAGVVVDREEGRDLLARELAGRLYADAQPSPVQRFLSWLFERLGELVPDDLDGGPVVDALVVGVVVLLVLLAARVAGQAVLRRRRAGADAEVFAGDVRRGADDHRARADAMAGEGRWPEAVAERFRAVVRGAEERVLVDEVPGRTAGEVAGELGRVLPDLAGDLAAGARVFDDVVYGSAPGTADDDARLRRLDDAVRAARPALPAAVGPEVP
jgi:hypothetical protein